MSLLRTGTLLLFASLATQTTAFDLVRDHSGQTFFDGWDFYGSWDNLTLGAFVFADGFLRSLTVRLQAT